MLQYFFREIDEAVGINTIEATKLNTSSSSYMSVETNEPPIKSLIANITDKASPCDCKNLEKVIGPFPFEPPIGYHWVLNGWKLEPIDMPSSSTPLASKSFEQLFLDKVKGPSNKAKLNRRKLDLRGKVYTISKIFLNT